MKNRYKKEGVLNLEVLIKKKKYLAFLGDKSTGNP